MDTIPVIDLVDATHARDKNTLDTLHKAFSDIGFVFIKHSLISQEKVSIA